MSLYRRAARRDATEPPIVAALEKCGQLVWRLREPLDLLVFDQVSRRFWLAEVKTPTGRLKSSQERLLVLVGDAPAYILRSVEDAVEAITELRMRR